MKKLILFSLVAMSCLAQETHKIQEMHCDVLGHDDMSAQIDIYANVGQKSARFVILKLRKAESIQQWQLIRRGDILPVYTNGEIHLKPWMDEGADYPTLSTPTKWYEFYCHSYI